MGMILEPEVGEEALYYHHGNTHKEGIGNAELRLEIEAIISKQSATERDGDHGTTRKTRQTCRSSSVRE